MGHTAIELMKSRGAAEGSGAGLASLCCCWWKSGRWRRVCPCQLWVAHYQYYTGGKGRTDHFDIRLKDGQEFSLGSVELAAFQRDAFESWVDRGDEITLWIDREEDGVFGGTEVIEVWSDDIGYLTYESCQEARERQSRELRRFAPIFLCVSLCSVAYADRIMWKRLKREEE